MDKLAEIKERVKLLNALVEQARKDKAPEEHKLKLAKELIRLKYILLEHGNGKKN